MSSDHGCSIIIVWIVLSILVVLTARVSGIVMRVEQYWQRGGQRQVDGPRVVVGQPRRALQNGVAVVHGILRDDGVESPQHGSIHGHGHIMELKKACKVLPARCGQL